jgi:hypothetical protein
VKDECDAVTPVLHSCEAFAKFHILVAGFDQRRERVLAIVGNERGNIHRIAIVVEEGLQRGVEFALMLTAADSLQGLVPDDPCEGDFKELGLTSYRF